MADWLADLTYGLVAGRLASGFVALGLSNLQQIAKVKLVYLYENRLAYPHERKTPKLNVWGRAKTPAIISISEFL